MEEAALCGVMVAGVMLGVPLWHSIGECRRGRMVSVHLFRWWIVCAFMLLLCFLGAILFVCFVVLLSNLPPPKLSSVSTSCKILSTGVDLRSAKICEVDNFPHMQNNGLSQACRSKFQCYFDYYWTSVFKVEYRPHYSDVPIEAAAEAPREALPIGCRPGFSAVWLAKERFQINADYPCKYKPGNYQWVELTDKVLGNCTSDEALNSNLYLHKFWKELKQQAEIFLSSPKTFPPFWRALLSISLGFFYSIFVTGVTKTACCLRYRVFETEGFSDIDVLYFEAQLQASFLVVACMFTLVWIGTDYEEQFESVTQYFIATLQRVFS